MTATKSLMDRFDAVSIPLPALLRISLGAYFVNAGVNKALDPVVFLKAVRLYDMLPETPAIFINTTAVVLPWFEILCGVALVLGLLRRGAGTIIALMLSVFSPAIFFRALVVMKEEAISFFEVAFDCGCGTGAETIWIKLSQNFGLCLVAICIIASRSDGFSVAALFGKSRSGASNAAA